MKLNKELNKECGERLKELLKEQKISQKELAEETNFTTQYISNIINGKKPMTVTAAKAFASKLGTTEAYLLCESDLIDDLSPEQWRNNFEYFQMSLHCLLSSFDIDIRGLILEDEFGKEYHYGFYEEGHFTLPIIRDEKDLHYTTFNDENGNPIMPKNPRVVLLLCKKKTIVSLASFRSLVKDIYEYCEFRTGLFAEKYSDAEQEINYWKWFEKE